MEKADFQSLFNFDASQEEPFPTTAAEWSVRSALMANREHSDHCEIHGPYSYKGGRRQECPQCAQEWARKQWENHLLWRMQRAGVGKRFINCTFNNWIVDENNVNQAGARDQLRDYVNNWQANFEAGRGIIFCGGVGGGKTHLGSALVRYALIKEQTAYISNLSDLLDTFKDSYRRDAEETPQELKERYSEVDWLVIDEVGLSAGTEAESRLLTQIIDARYRNSKPTVLISNLEPIELAKAINERAMSRFADALVIAFDWPDYRRALAAKQQQKSNGEQS